jgi:hypothetical protein
MAHDQEASGFSRRLHSKGEARVTDQDTGKTYLVRGASCGLPRCYCDAVIAAELKSRLH